MTTVPNPMQVPIVDYTLLPVEMWRSRIGYNPWHFWQLANLTVPLTSACNALVFQYAWQSADASGRKEIADAILRAEAKLAETLRYSVRPRYREVEMQWPRYPKPNIQRLGYAGSDNRWEAIRLPEGYIQAAGVEVVTAVNEAAVPVYTDADGDGLKEKVTITVATTVTNKREIAVYFNSVDRGGEAVSNRWRIEPLKVTISGGNAIITGYRWQFVKPILYEGVGKEALDPAVDGNFAATVSVYRRYTNQDGITNTDCQALLVWETPPYPQWAASFSIPAPYGLDPAGAAFAISRVGIRDAKIGIVSVGEAIWNATDSTWNAVPWYASSFKYRPPDRIIIRYLAGYQNDDDGNMQETMATTVAMLAAAELNRRICAYDSANRQLYDWQFDLARTSGSGDEAYAMMSRNDLDNPFGTRRGQVMAYKNVKRNRLLGGFVP